MYKIAPRGSEDGTKLRMKNLLTARDLKIDKRTLNLKKRNSPVNSEPCAFTPLLFEVRRERTGSKKFATKQLNTRVDRGRTNWTGSFKGGWLVRADTSQQGHAGTRNFAGSVREQPRQQTNHAASATGVKLSLKAKRRSGGTDSAHAGGMASPGAAPRRMCVSL